MSKQTLTSHNYLTTITRNSKGAITSSQTRYIGFKAGSAFGDDKLVKGAEVGSESEDFGFGRLGSGSGTAGKGIVVEDFRAGSLGSGTGTARDAKPALNTYPFRPTVISYSSGDFVLWLDTDRLITNFEDALLLSELLTNAVDHIKYLKEELKDKS